MHFSSYNLEKPKILIAYTYLIGFLLEPEKIFYLFDFLFCLGILHFCFFAYIFCNICTYQIKRARFNIQMFIIMQMSHVQVELRKRGPEHCHRLSNTNKLV